MDVNLGIKIFQFAVLILSVNFHEFCHGLAAYLLGDDTAKKLGRLTLNPLAHIDPVGTLLLPIILIITNAGFIFGWAKPVPYNPRLLRDQKYGSLKVGLAGPMANIAIACILAVLLRLSIAFSFNFSPILILCLQIIIFINIFIALFNLLPFPPLDGSKVFSDLVPQSRRLLAKIEPFGILLALLCSALIFPIASVLFGFLVGLR